MTAARDELRRLVEQLPEQQLSTALSELRRLTGKQPTGSWPPKWFGSIHGPSDLSERIDDYLAEGFGQPRS